MYESFPDYSYIFTDSLDNINTVSIFICDKNDSCYQYLMSISSPNNLMFIRASVQWFGFLRDYPRCFMEHGGIYIETLVSGFRCIHIFWSMHSSPFELRQFKECIRAKSYHAFSIIPKRNFSKLPELTVPQITTLAENSSSICQTDFLHVRFFVKEFMSFENNTIVTLNERQSVRRFLSKH